MKRLNKRILSALAFIFVTCVLLLAYSYFIEPRRLVVTEQTLTIKDWDPALDGFRMVAIGDIHGGSNAVDEAKIRRVVETANAQNPDLVVLLGDYVSQASYWSKLGDHDLK